MDREQYDDYTISELRSVLAGLGGAPGNKKKAVLIDEIEKIREGVIKPVRSNRGRRSSRQKRTDSNQGRRKRGVENNENNEDNDVLNDFIKDTEVEGILETVSDGGYLVGLNFMPTKKDLYVSSRMIAENRLASGDRICGLAGKGFSINTAELKSVTSVNGKEKRSIPQTNFDDLAITPITEKITLSSGDNLLLSAIDVLAPIGKGQRGIVVSPQNAYKITFIKALAHSLSQKKEIKTILVLIDERPEDLAAIKSSCFDVEIASTTFDRGPKEHIAVCKTAFERAKSLAADGNDVMIVFDSATKLAKAYYRDALQKDEQQSYATQSSILKVKQHLATARNLTSGSISVLAFTDISSNLAEDRAIAEELKQICNMHLVFLQEAIQKRVFPPIDLRLTGSENQDVLLSEKDFAICDTIQQIVFSNPKAETEILKVLQKNIYDDRLQDKLFEVKASTKNSDNGLID